MFTRERWAVRLIVVGLLGLLASLPATAGVQVSPTGLFLDKSQRVSVLTLTNRQTQSVHYQVQAYQWDQVEGEDRLEESRELLISPPIFSIEPGAKQTVRVAVRRAFPVDQEASYRVILRELPNTDNDGGQLALQMALAISIPVFLKPDDKDTHADMQWQASIDEATQSLLLTAENRGGKHQKVTRLTLTDGEDEPLGTPKQQLVYLLPGTTRQWYFPMESMVGLEPGATINIRAVSGRQNFDASVLLE